MSETKVKTIFQLKKLKPHILHSAGRFFQFLQQTFQN